MKPLYNNIGKKVIIKYLSTDICNDMPHFKQFLNKMGIVLNIVGNCYRVEFFESGLTEFFFPEELLILDESKKSNTFIF